MRSAFIKAGWIESLLFGCEVVIMNNYIQMETTN
jgi:hypothetical protein